jgi:hypothetical protein
MIFLPTAKASHLVKMYLIYIIQEMDQMMIASIKLISMSQNHGLEIYDE